jgi:hypothetical protein
LNLFENHTDCLETTCQRQAVWTPQVMGELTDPSSIVRMDVGGRKFTSMLSTLCRVEDSMLARMLTAGLLTNSGGQGGQGGLAGPLGLAIP